jgi:hypothetical protein
VGTSALRIHRPNQLPDTADLREVSKSFGAALLTGNIFFEHLLSEVKTNPFPILEAVGDGFGQAVHANGYAVNSLVDDALGECVSSEPDEAHQLPVHDGLFRLRMDRHPDWAGAARHDPMKHERGFETHDSVWDSFRR